MSATADEQALLDEALRQADERLAASLQRDELRRRRRRWLALGGFAMTITVAAIVASLMVGGQKTEPRESKEVSPSEMAAARELVSQAENLRKSGRLAEAEIKFEAAVGRDPGSVEGWVGLGWVRKNQGEYKGAEAAFKRCLKLDESCPNANNGPAWIHFNQSQYPVAERYWRKIVAQPSVPRDNTRLSRGGAFSAREGLARLCLLDGRFDEAAK